MPCNGWHIAYIKVPNDSLGMLFRAKILTKYNLKRILLRI